MRTLAILTVKEWHFREPVFPGDTIHVVSTVLEKQLRGRGRRGEITWRRQIFNQDGKVIMEGITITLVEGRGKPGSTTSTPEATADAAEDESR
jgi:acyl dehydratase